MGWGGRLENEIKSHNPTFHVKSAREEEEGDEHVQLQIALFWEKRRWVGKEVKKIAFDGDTQHTRSLI